MTGANNSGMRSPSRARHSPPSAAVHVERAMLSFMGIGAQKAGTTWLHANLARHPRIGFPGGKEVHYWNARRAVLPEQWYRDLFATGDGRVNGDITPAYSTLEPEVVARIGALFPDLRILFLLRDPIERAWSAALMALGRAELTLGEVWINGFSTISTPGALCCAATMRAPWLSGARCFRRGKCGCCFQGYPRRSDGPAAAGGQFFGA